MIQRISHNATVLSGKEESEEGEDSKSDEYKSEEKKSEKYANLLVLCTGVWKMICYCCATEQDTIFLFVAQKYIFVTRKLIFLM